MGEHSFKGLTPFIVETHYSLLLFFYKIIMKRYTLVFILLLLPFATYAQHFTDSLRTPNRNGGIVVLKQSAKIDSLVNGLKPKTPVKSPITPIFQHRVDSVQLDSLGNPIVKGYLNKEGYRIQIFTGANSREDKEKALKLQRRSEDLFPDMKSYCSFISPRWVVRIGDFSTREEAMLRITEVRESGLSKEVRLVRCKVQIPIY